MLTYLLREGNSEGGVELRLSGRTVWAYRTRWSDADKRWVPASHAFAKALWDFGRGLVVVADAAMPRDLIEVANRAFGAKLRELDRPRQCGIFGGGCSVCGADRNTYPETAVRDAHGNIMETCGGQKWMAPDEPVRWSCHVCARLVCRRCTLLRPDSSHPAGLPEHYFHTYCSEACRAAAPVGFAEDDALH